MLKKRARVCGGRERRKELTSEGLGCAAVPEYLREKGFRVLLPKVSNMGHVRERGVQLGESIAKWSDRREGERVIIISHSMGGLDSRYFISKLGGHKYVESLVTVGTPHNGCSVADLVVEQVPKFSHVANVLKNQMGFSLEALNCLTRHYAQQFNAACPDVPNVKYYSVSGQKGNEPTEYSPILRPSLKYVAEREGPNDGMVSVQSSIWGQHLGVLPLDHLEQTHTEQLYDSVLDTIQRRRGKLDLNQMSFNENMFIEHE